MPKLEAGVGTYVHVKKKTNNKKQATVSSVHAHCKLLHKERVVQHSDATEKNVYA